MRWLVFLFAGCATPSAAVLPPSGCLDLVRHGKHSHLMKNGVEIPYDVLAATLGDPEAQRLAARAQNEETATLVFAGAAPLFFLSAIGTSLAGSDGPRHLAPWAEKAVPSLLGAEGLSIAIALGLAVTANAHRKDAIARYNEDAGCR